MEQVELSIICPSVSFIFAIFTFPFFIRIATKWRLFDSFSDHKIHAKFKPSAGGAVIFVGFVLSVMAGIYFFDLSDRFFFLSALTLLFLLGLGDDIIGFSPFQKLLIQSLITLIVIFFDGLVLNQLDFFLQVIDAESWLYFLITFFVVLFVINSYNFIDGLDGLAGSIGILILSFFGGWFYLINDYILYVFCLSLATALIAFVIFNWHPSKILMGDTGTLFIGLFLAYCAINFLNLNDKITQQTIKFHAPITTMICVFIVPVFDTIRVILIRVRKRQSPIRADRQHIHHQLLRMGYSHSKAVMILLVVNVFFIFTALILRKQSEFVSLPIVIIVCLLINFIFRKLYKHDGKNFSTE